MYVSSFVLIVNWEMPCLAHRHNMLSISVSEHLLILPFFMRGGVALHERFRGFT